MSFTTKHDVPSRPSSPWPGSDHQTRHRWQLDRSRSLSQAADHTRVIAAELAAAHAAGWWLVEPMRSGHLVAARASRRRRVRLTSASSAAVAAATSGSPGWRLRVVEEPPQVGEETLDTAMADRTPVLGFGHGVLAQISGPLVPDAVLTEVSRQVNLIRVVPERWGLAWARVGPNLDLVADGSAMRAHQVCDGVLVRTVEALTFQHAADGAGTLLQASEAYERLARAADAMTAAGGRLIGVDDGIVQVGYSRSAL